MPLSAVQSIAEVETAVAAVRSASRLVGSPGPPLDVSIHPVSMAAELRTVAEYFNRWTYQLSLTELGPSTTGRIAQLIDLLQPVVEGMPHYLPGTFQVVTIELADNQTTTDVQFELRG